VRLSLPEPISDPADLARAAERLTLDLVSRLAREGMGARRIDLGFHRVDGRVEHIRIGTARPSRDPVHLAKLLTGKLDTVDPGLGIEDIILAAFAVEKLAPEQIAMTGAAGPSDGDTAPLFDRLGARLGLNALARLESRESHIPERASVAVPIETGSRPPPQQSPVATGEGGARSARVRAGTDGAAEALFGLPGFAPCLRVGSRPARRSRSIGQLVRKTYNTRFIGHL
jgi:nucleotidyltransferase/DNA polymerase involved in DNA repair